MPGTSVEGNRDQVATLRRSLRTASALAARRRYTRALALLDEVLAHEEPQDPAALLQELRALRSAVAAQRRLLIHRAAMIAVFLGCVIAVGLLQLTPVASTKVVVELRTRGVFFNLAEAASLRATPLTAVLLGSGQDLLTYTGDIRIDASTGAGMIMKPNPLQPVLIRGPQPRLTGDDLALTRLHLQPGVPIEIRSSGGPLATLSIRHGAPTKATVRTAESVTVECNPCELSQEQTQLARQVRRLIIRPRPREVQVVGTEAVTDIGLVLAADAASGEYGADRRLRLASIDFTVSEIDRLESLIQGGTVRLSDMNDRAIALGEGDFLYLEGPEDLTIARLALGPEIGLRLEGRVQSVATGAGATRHPRNPSRLEWIAANEPRKLFFVGVAAVFGFLLAAAARLRISDLK
jgi:hypothetical protein